MLINLELSGFLITHFINKKIKINIILDSDRSD